MLYSSVARCLSIVFKVLKVLARKDMINQILGFNLLTVHRSGTVASETVRLGLNRTSVGKTWHFLVVSILWIFIVSTTKKFYSSPLGVGARGMGIVSTFLSFCPRKDMVTKCPWKILLTVQVSTSNAVTRHQLAIAILESVKNVRAAAFQLLWTLFNNFLGCACSKVYIISFNLQAMTRISNKTINGCENEIY